MINILNPMTFFSKLSQAFHKHGNLTVSLWYLAIKFLLVAILSFVYSRVHTRLALGRDPVYDFKILLQVFDFETALTLVLAAGLIIVSFILERNFLVYYSASRYQSVRVSGTDFFRSFIGTVFRQFQLFLLEIVIYFGLLVVFILLAASLFSMLGGSMLFLMAILILSCVAFLAWFRTFFSFIFALFRLFSTEEKGSNVFSYLAQNLPQGSLRGCLRIWTYYLIVVLVFGLLLVLASTAAQWFVSTIANGEIELFLMILFLFLSAAISVIVTGIIAIMFYGDTIEVLVGYVAPPGEVKSKKAWIQKLLFAGPIAVYLVVIGAMSLIGFSQVRPLLEKIEVPRQIFAHRGLSISNVQNSIASFQGAIGNADYIELDVQITKDGQLIVFHDENFENLTGEIGVAAQRNYAEISTYSVSESKLIGEQEVVLKASIPLLEEVFKAIGDRIPFAIEIKNTAPEKMPELVQKLVDLMQRYDQLEKSYVISLDYSVLEEVQRVEPDVQRGIIMTLSVAPPSAYDVDIYFLNALGSSSDLLRDIHALGRKAYYWSFSQIGSDFSSEFFIGADGFVADDPHRVQQLILEYRTFPLTRKIAIIFSKLFG